MTRQTGALIGLSAVASFLLGVVAAGTRPPPSGATQAIPAPPGHARPLTITSVGRTADRPVLAGGAPLDFATVVERINAAVVNVDTASRGTETRPRFRYSTTDPDAPREGSGSGFIIDPDGFILTNHHVVAGADRVTVTLSDGRTMRADVIGSDPVIDVALLQVQVDGPLPVAPLGDSDRLRVGEWVCAIGNPLGVYVHSVTVGVVSFLGRKLFDQTLDNYIQTDAAISVGNSGGPLINQHGEVVGITTAISSQAANIGFAIPISQVIDVLPQLREFGTVTRGSIGVGLASVTGPLRRALSLGPTRGALVQDVQPDTPAERGGLRTYDVIVGVDGRGVVSDEDLIRYIASQAPGTGVTIRVWRDGQEQDIAVRLAQRPVTARARPAPIAAAGATGADAWAPLGLRVRELDTDAIARLRLPVDIAGVLVSDVDPAGPSRLASLRINHVILEVNRQPVTSVEAWNERMTTLAADAPVALLVFDRTTGERILCTVFADPAS